MTFVYQPLGCFPREGGRDLRCECFIVRVAAQALGAGSRAEGGREGCWDCWTVRGVGHGDRRCC